MTLGQRIRHARLEAGLSQRQLCGDAVTRNMLSQIENGTARPSMSTLSYLAEQLGKPISYFLEENTVCSPNQDRMAAARAAVATGNGSEALEILSDYSSPDPVFDMEKQLLERIATLQAAQSALDQDQSGLAAQLLETEDQWADGYCADALERKRLLLLGQARPKLWNKIYSQLPSPDEELLLLAQAALGAGFRQQGLQYLEAVQTRDTALWNLMRGELYLQAQEYSEAVRCFRKAEETYPEKCAKQLELCYRELGDFQQAYYYACKQRGT